MKKILLSLLALCSITTAWAQTSDVVEVYDDAGLIFAIMENPSANIKLMRDIDLSCIKNPVADTFKGHIDGKYQYTNSVGEVRDTLYSIKGGGERISYIFKNLDHAIIENVKLDGIKIYYSTDSNYGALARTASYTQFNNVQMVGVSVTSNFDNAGGLVGKADHCYFDNIAYGDCSVKANGIGAGGIVGESTACTFTNCLNNMRCSVYADGRYLDNYAKAGGFTGSSDGDVFTNCVNLATVGGNEDSVGGLVGYCEITKFFGCTNSGVVCHANEEDFEKVVSGIKKKLDELSTKDEGLTAAIRAAGEYAGALALGVLTAVGIGAAFGVPGALASFLSFLGFAGPIGVVVAAAIVVTEVLVYQAVQHDEIGGICGYSTGGSIVNCTNSGFINCKDSQGGGIVGRAKNVVINNCVSKVAGKWGDSDCGAIVGEATQGCRVSNCLSWTKDPVIAVGKDMDASSLNNYSLSDKASEWEIRVNEEQLKSGLVARWLNNGFFNRLTGETPWQQNSEEGPVINEGFPVVTLDMLCKREIGTPEELVAFAEDVNSGQQFLCAKLVDDINMTGTLWTPIGKNESYKQFRGVFDGQGHTIKGLEYTDKQPNQAAGLFGAVNTNAEIANVIIGKGSEITVKGNEGAGAIVGRVAINGPWGDVIIDNCGSYADVKANTHAGGILGHVSTGSDNDQVRVIVNNCFNMGTISADNGESGLLCGYMKNNGVVTNSWSAGQLRVSQGHSTWPYSIDNPASEGEFLAGYGTGLSISNCFVVDMESNVDRYSEYPLQNGVTNLPATSVKSGQLAHRLSLGRSDSNWQQVLGVDTIPNFGSEGTYHSRTISENSMGYGTICVPFAMESNDEVSYYRFVESKDEDGDIILSFTYAETVDPGEPVLFSTSKIGDITFRGEGEEWVDNPKNNISAYADWLTLGTFTEQVFTNETTPRSDYIYYVSGGKIRNAHKVTIAPFRAYFGGPSISSLTAAGAKTISIVIDDEEGETTALKFVNDEIVSVQKSGKTYSVMGTEVNEDYRGIVIKNGKKYLNN